ncbi:sulfotransferase 6B1-like [Tachysurus ichikawai]
MADQKFNAKINESMMQGKSMKDEEKLYKRNGILYPTIMSPPENLDALKDMEAREDDVMLVSYPKCGCNWMVGVLRKIMSASAYTLPEGPPLIEFHSPESQKGKSMKDEEKLYKRNGILYPTIMSPPENLDALKDMEAREDDVMLVSYPKCGE